MNRTQLPTPPDPARFANVLDWQREAYRWMQQVKGRIETDSAVNVTPVGPFVVGTYTATATVTGTDALSNFVATLVAGLQVKGITAGNIQRTTT